MQKLSTGEMADLFAIMKWILPTIAMKNATDVDAAFEEYKNMRSTRISEYSRLPTLDKFIFSLDIVNKFLEGGSNIRNGHEWIQYCNTHFPSTYIPVRCRGSSWNQTRLRNTFLTYLWTWVRSLKSRLVDFRWR